MARRLILATIVLLAAGVAGATVPVDRVLVVEDAASGERLLSASVEDGTRIALEYNHSVEKTRVMDVYAVDGDRLVMTRMEFSSYGWGLPAEANVTTENDSFSFDPEWEGTELYVSPGKIAGHRLLVGDRSWDLVALSDGDSVRIHLARRSAFAVAARTVDGGAENVATLGPSGGAP